LIKTDKDNKFILRLIWAATLRCWYGAGILKKIREQAMSERILLGISSCLLGENVRYDGGHKLDRCLRDTLGQFVQWVAVCPEVECGLGIPREAMRLEGNPEHPRLVTTLTKIDHTKRMQKWIGGKLEQLAKLDLCGFVFKSKSPSCGMTAIEVFMEKNNSAKKGIGLFAAAFMRQFPLLPVEEDIRLHDAGVRENFIERIFTGSRNHV
jgi:uncharacterized protein YbbK (DUF523 family)